MTAVLPPDAIEAVAAELRRRLVSPTPGTSDKERQRLRTRMEQLRKQNEWGDLPDTEYRRLRSEVEADLLAIPGETEKVVLFDRHRLVVQSLGDELATATPEAIQSVVVLLVERVETRDRQVVGWVPTGPAEPFFHSALRSAWRPRTDSGPQYQRSALDWYLEIGCGGGSPTLALRHAYFAGCRTLAIGGIDPP